MIIVATPRWSVTAEARLDAGVDPTEGMLLGVGAVGVRLALTPSLALDLAALGVAPLSDPADGRAANPGGGGELGLRVFPLPDATVRPYFRTTMGLAFFGRARPFLPGADVYEGVLTWGLGLELTLGPARLVLDAHYMHLSNGQGLGVHNPAFDGFGGTVGVSLPFAGAAVTPGWSAGSDPLSGARRDAAPGADVDLGAGGVDGAALFSLRLRVAQRLADPLLVLLDVEAAALAASPLGEAGLGVVWHSPWLTLGAHLGYRSWSGIDVVLGALQVDWHVTGEVSIVGLAHAEESDLDGLSWRAALGARVHPTRTLALDIGVGFDAIGRAADDRSDPYLGVEWAALAVGRWTFALFLERQISTVDVLGLRVTLDAPDRGPRDAARHTSWRRLR